MVSAQLLQVAVFLAAAAIAAPLGRFLRMGAVLGYLAAGILIGPYILGPLYALNDVGEVLHFGEFGVVLLLFVIGLELRPVRLWALFLGISLFLQGVYVPIFQGVEYVTPPVSIQ